MTSSGPDTPTTSPGSGFPPAIFWCDIARDVVEVVGADAATYLHSQVSNDLRPLQVGQSCWAFLLQPTGKVDVLLRVWRTADDRFVLDTDAGFGEVLVARVNRFKIRVKADVAPLPWRCIAVRSTDGSLVTGIDGLAAWGGGVDLLGADVEPPAGIARGTVEQLLAARIEAGWPAMGTEIEPGETIPAETGVTSTAVSFTKGCYPGQELVERMDSRGSIAPRLLQVVDVAPGTAAGEALRRDGEAIGTVTSVAGGRALAFVKRSALQA
jgi:folate-binding protein YgfZ